MRAVKGIGNNDQRIFGFKLQKVDALPLLCRRNRGLGTGRGGISARKASFGGHLHAYMCRNSQTPKIRPTLSTNPISSPLMSSP